MIMLFGLTGFYLPQTLRRLWMAIYKDERQTDKVIAFMDKVCETKIQPFIDVSYKELADYVHAYEQKMENETRSPV
jgi:hypothetical protein